MAVLRAQGDEDGGDTLHRPLDHRLAFRLPYRGAKPRSAARPAIIPSISGRAWITGTHQHMLDPTTRGPRAIASRIPGLVFDPQKVAPARAMPPPAPDPEYSTPFLISSDLTPLNPSTRPFVAIGVMQHRASGATVMFHAAVALGDGGYRTAGRQLADRVQPGFAGRSVEQPGEPACRRMQCFMSSALSPRIRLT